MKRRNFIQAGLGLGMLSSVQAAQPLGLHWQDITFTGLGTVMSIRAAHTSVEALQLALQRARQVIAQVEDDMSLFRANSALSQLNRDGVLRKPPAQLLHVLQLSKRVAQQSQGAFDVTVQPLWQLYAQAQKDGRLPTSQQVEQAQRLVGWRYLDVAPTQITLRQPGMGVSLNGVAQGYAADLVKASLKRDGVLHALINTGEWSALGLADGQRPWMLGIAHPRGGAHPSEPWLARVAMRGLSMATSADDQCTFSDDRVHHHIFNPHTGYSPQDIASVTVAAPDCAMADALTKVLFVAGYAQALHVAKAWGVPALVVNKTGEWKASKTWTRVAV
jgi:thiamine biosynthesis lipoprotein